MNYINNQRSYHAVGNFIDILWLIKLISDQTLEDANYLLMGQYSFNWWYAEGIYE